VILETIAGSKDVTEACNELGIGKSAFHELRSELLKSAVETLEPKNAGRPRNVISLEQAELDNLKAEVRRLRAELDVSHIKEELILGMPHLFNPVRDRGKKGVKKAKT
jgi:hypothetical protein